MATDASAAIAVDPPIEQMAAGDDVRAARGQVGHGPGGVVLQCGYQGDEGRRGLFLREICRLPTGFGPSNTGLKGLRNEISSIQMERGGITCLPESRCQVSQDRGASWSEPADVPREFGGAVEAASPLLVAAAAGREAVCDLRAPVPCVLHQRFSMRNTQRGEWGGGHVTARAYWLGHEGRHLAGRNVPASRVGIGFGRIVVS